MNAARGVAAFACGVVFALGLGIAGMTRPEKIQGYLDFVGAWDPTLLFVMASGVGTFSLAYAIARRRPRPACDERFHWPSRLPVDAKTVVGAGIFGVGWALAGFCPGPAITSLVTLQTSVLAFVVGLFAGVLAFQTLQARERSRGAARPEAVSTDAP
jgi:hypothetical protein